MKQDINRTLTSLRQTLAYDYRIVPIETPGSLVFLAVALPLAPEVTGLKPRLPSGRGINLPQAMISAGAEALELRASLAMNNAARIADLPRQDGRSMIEARDLRTGAGVFLPAQAVFLDFPAPSDGASMAEARSTGCATGPHRQAATQQALLECIERDALAYWWHGGMAAHGLPLELIDRFAPRLSWWLEGRTRQTRLLGLASQTGVPVVVAVSSDPEGRNIAIGSAAGFSRNAACLFAVTEMIQTETALHAALAADDDEAQRWCRFASIGGQVQFNPLQGAPVPAVKTRDFGGLLDQLAVLGLSAFSVDLTLPGDPLPTVRVLVPGLCDMGGRIDEPLFRHHCAITDPAQKPLRHDPEPF